MTPPKVAQMECCKKAATKDESQEFAPGKAEASPIRVRVICELPWHTREWPGDSMLAMLVKNDSQERTFSCPLCKSETYGWHNRAYINDYQPHDELNVYIYREDTGGIEGGYIEKIPIPDGTIQESLTAELMGADGDRHDVMVVCSVKIKFSGNEWMREISAYAQLMDKGAELHVPGSPELEE